MKKVKLILIAFTVSAFTLTTTSCSKEEDTPEPIELGDDENNNNNGNGSSGFTLSDVEEFDIDEINITAFDFTSSNEPDQEFYIEVWDGANYNYQGDISNCTTQQTEVGDLPEELLCISYLTYQYASFNNDIEIELWDEDQNSNDDSFGAVSFKPADYIDAESGTKTIILSNGGNIGYTVEILISW